MVQNITGTIQRCPVHLKSMQTVTSQYSSTLADTLPLVRKRTSIELIIGNDYYLDLILPQRVELRPGLYLLESEFELILTGRSSELTFEKQEANTLVLIYGIKTETDTNLFAEVDKSLYIYA